MLFRNLTYCSTKKTTEPVLSQRLHGGLFVFAASPVGLTKLHNRCRKAGRGIIEYYELAGTLDCTSRALVAVSGGNEAGSR